MDEAPRPLSSDPPDLNDAAPKGAQGGPAPATDATAMELATDGITANNVAPGPIETELFAQNTPPGSPARAAFVSTVPMRRMGQPEEVAEAVAYFLSDRAGYTTGQTLYVCGGMSVASPA